MDLGKCFSDAKIGEKYRKENENAHKDPEGGDGYRPT